MEHLASHGYVVIATSHPYASMRVVSPDGRANISIWRKSTRSLLRLTPGPPMRARRCNKPSSAEERTRLLLERYEGANGLNALMAIWVDDLRFVLDSITTPSGRDPKLQAISTRIDADRIGLLGMSFGGGAVTETHQRATLAAAQV